MLSDTERKQAQRLRTKKHREKVKQRSADEAAAAEQRRFEKYNQWRRTERLVMPGEVEAFRDAENCVDATAVAREFLVALNLPGVQHGESLLCIERRVLTAYAAAGAPLLNRDTIRLETSVASTECCVFATQIVNDFDNRWIPLPGADEVIDVSTLQAIVVPEAVSPPGANTDTPVILENWRLPAYAPTLEEQLAMEHRHQTGLCRVSPQEALMLKIQQDAMDEKARKLSAANEARELTNERKLGSAYVPSSELHFRNSR